MIQIANWISRSLELSDPTYFVESVILLQGTNRNRSLAWLKTLKQTDEVKEIIKELER